MFAYITFERTEVDKIVAYFKVSHHSFKESENSADELGSVLSVLPWNLSRLSGLSIGSDRRFGSSHRPIGR